MTALSEREPCASFVELQEQHSALVKAVLKSNSPEAQASIRDFVTLCLATGHVLDSAADRSAAQSLITFWINRLERIANDAAKLQARSSTTLQDDPTAECSDQGLLADFDQDVFDQFVLAPTEQWLDSLSESDQTLVRRIVLRLIRLNAKDHFETIPNTRAILESLEPPDRASQLLDKLVSMGIVRRLRHSLEFEEYALQSLDRLKNFRSLQIWMAQREQFRIKAKRMLALQLQQTEHPPFEPLVMFSRKVRHLMTLAGALMQRMLHHLPYWPSLVQSPVEFLSSHEMEEAEFYRDKNSIEVKTLYLKRQLERHQLETNQERLFGISAAACVFVLLTIVAFAQRNTARARTRDAVAASQKAQAAEEQATKTQQVVSLLLAEQQIAQDVSSMTSDPASALLRGIDSLARFDKSKEVIVDHKLADAWRESYLWTLGSARLQSPMLTDLIFPPTLTSKVRGNAAPEGLTLLSDNGDACWIVEMPGRTIQARMHTRNPDGSWSRHVKDITLPEQVPSVDGASLQAFVNADGNHLAIALRVPKGQDHGEPETHLILGDAMVQNGSASAELSTTERISPQLRYAGKFTSLQTACFDGQGKYFALACNLPISDGGTPTTALHIFATTPNTTANIERAASVSQIEGIVHVMAFSKERTPLSNRGQEATSTIRLAACVQEKENRLVVQQTDLAYNGNNLTKQSSELLTIGPWKLLLKSRWEAASTPILIYSPQRTESLFFSEGPKQWLITLGNSQPRLLTRAQENTDTMFQSVSLCTSAAFSPLGTHLAIGARDGRVAMWEISENETTPVRELPLASHPQHSEQVFGIRFSPDGKYLVSSSRDKRVLIYDVVFGRLACPPIHHNSTVNAAAVSTDGLYLATIAKRVVLCWQFPPSRWLPRSTGIPDGRSILTTASSPDGYVVAGGGDAASALRRGWFHIWNERTGESMGPVVELSEPLVQVALSDDGRWVSAIDQNGNLTVYSGGSNAVWSKSAEKYSPGFCRIVADEGSVRLLLIGPAAPDGPMASRVQVWRWPNVKVVSDSASVTQLNPELLIDTEYDTDLVSAEFDPCADGYVAHGSEGQLFYCGITQGSQPVPLLLSNSQRPHSEWITHLAFNKSARLLISGSEDDRATVWLMTQPGWQSQGQRLEVLDGDSIAPNTANINYVASNPTGRELVTASADGSAIVWQQTAGAARFKPYYSIKPVGSASGLIPAMVQAEFIQQPREVEGRYMFCRWSDGTIRIFDTLNVSNPLTQDQPLLQGREVASFVVPHNVDRAHLSAESDGSWRICASGYENPARTEESNANEFCAFNNAYSGAQLWLSHWQVTRFPENFSWGNDVSLKMAGLLSGRRLSGELRPLEPLPINSLLADWQAGTRPIGLHQGIQSLDTTAWHLAEADSSLVASADPRISLWHWDAVLNQKTLPAEVHLKRARALAAIAEWQAARSALQLAEADEQLMADVIKLRADIEFQQACTSNFDKALLRTSASYYDKYLKMMPQDTATHLRLASIYERLEQAADALKEVDQLAKDMGDLVTPEVLKKRGSLRSKLQFDSREIYADFKRSGELFFQAGHFVEAHGELMGAKRLLESRLPLNRNDSVELADIHQLIGQTWLQRDFKSEVERIEHQKNAAQAFLQASQREPNSMPRMKLFFDSLNDLEITSDEQWQQADEVFQRALSQSPEDTDLHRQRIAALLPPQSLNTESEQLRLERVLSAYEQWETEGVWSQANCLNLAAIHVRMEQLTEAEQCLREAWQKQQDSTLLGLRLSLVLMLQGKTDEYKQVVKSLVEANHEFAIDKNNSAWSAVFAADSYSDFEKVAQLAESANGGGSANPNFLNTLGAVYVRAGKFEQAINTLSKASTLRESLPPQDLSEQEKLLGGALDLLFTSMAQSDTEAEESLERSKHRFESYRKDWPKPNQFFRWVWNTNEYQLLQRELESP